MLNLEWVASTPKRNDEKTLIRCLDCGNQWDVYPANIAKGRKSCAPCALAASRVPKEVWVSRLLDARALWVDETPHNNSDKSKIAKCQVCFQTWAVDPRKIDKGHPKCSGRDKSETVSENEWKERAKNSNIEWLSIPNRSKVKTPAKCLICGFQWEPRPDNVLGGSACPKCAQSRSSTRGNNRVSEAEWDIRAETAGVRWVESRPTASTERKLVECLSCHYQWSPLATSISKGAGCPSCAGNAKVSQEEWDRRAALVGLRWLNPVSGGRHSKALAECVLCNHAWSVEVGSIAEGHGCPKCSEEKRRRSRLLSPETWIARAESANLKWLELPDNNSTKKLIQCQSCLYEWQVIPESISQGAGCPICSGVLVESKTWEARAESVGIEWLEIPTSSRRPAKARCLKCGLIWSPNPGAVSDGSGCPDCAETGYRVGQPGLFYLVERGSIKGRAARKIGITNIAGSEKRLNLWKRQGFTLRAHFTHDDGGVILQLETRILQWLRRELGLPSYLDKEEMPQGGASETLSPDDPSDELLLQKIELEFNSLSKERSSSP